MRPDQQRRFVALAASFGGLAVIAGAFGAHALKGRLSIDSLQLIDTAVRYQFWHALAIAATALSGGITKSRKLLIAARSFTAGIVLFCGSLYALAFIADAGSPVKMVIGPVTPVGGLFLIAGWVFLAWAMIDDR